MDTLEQALFAVSVPYVCGFSHMFVVTIQIENGSRFSVGSILTSMCPRFSGRAQIAKDCILVWGWEPGVLGAACVWSGSPGGGVEGLQHRSLG